MNTAQDAIEQLNDANIFDSVAETIASGVNDVTAYYEDAAASFQAEQQNGTWIETVPAYEQEPWTETYPAPENTEPQIESFPATQDEEPTITVFPHAKPEIPSIETIPAETPKELGDNILWNSGNKGVGNAIDPSKLSDVWKLGATERGDVIEEVLASTEYKDWYNIGSSQGEYFPVIDFQKGSEVVSLKTIDPTLPSYTGDMATEKILEYLQDLNRNITVDGQLADKTLDVRIPEGTIDRIDVQEITTQAKDMGINVQIKEFK